MSSDSQTSQSMSTTGNPPFTLHSRAKKPESDQVDQDLIVETRNQIRQLVDEITQLSQSNCSKLEFYEGFLTRCTQALASVGGAIWEINNGGLNLEYQVNLSETSLTDEETRKAHNGLLGKLVASGESRLIPPNSGNVPSSGQDSDAIGNPTEHLLVVVPLLVNQTTVGLIEIFQRTDAGPATQRGYLRFLDQMGAAANGFLNSYQLREFDGRQQMWQQLDQFVRNIHESLDVKQTMFAIANEGRRVIDCDRVSVALQQGRRVSVKAVSGLDSIERRAEQIKRLDKLTRAVAYTKEPLWYAGDDSQLPPQIETCLHEYIDVSHSKIVGILPLNKIKPEPIADREDQQIQRRQSTATIGALIIEQISDEDLSESLKTRSQAVAEHGSYALTNSLDHNSILFASVWKRLGQVSAIANARNLPKTLLALGLLTVAIALLCLMPTTFNLGATGELVPKTTHEVYARTDGFLLEILVPDNPDEPVRQGQPLARMENNDLMVEVRDLQGKLKQSIEQIEKFNRAQNTNLDQVELYMMESELDEAFVAKETYERQLEIKLRELELLQVTAPADGCVVNWQLRENLIRRSIQKGQNLMTIVDPGTEWLVELEVPERRSMHLLAAIKEAKEELTVMFTLSSHPGKQFQGKLTKVDQRLDVHSDNGNTLRVIVSFDKNSIPPELLRDGTRVTAKIDAGTRSLGYVWLHELFETVQSSVLFWF